jgi:hypothetical protein
VARLKKRDSQYLERCRADIASARRFREEEGYDLLWERLIDLYAGKHWPKEMSTEDKIVVNISFATINVIAPSVSINNPKIVVEARSPEDQDAATITEAVVNYWWKHYDVHPQFRRAVDDFLMLGFGWLKTGYRYVEEEAEDAEGYLQELEAAAADVQGFAAENPELADGLPGAAEIAANIPTTRMAVVDDRPFVERVSPYDVFVDPEATDLADARWIAHRVIRSIEDVHDDDSYDATNRKKVRADGRVRDELRPDSAKNRDPHWMRATIWEFYDLKSGQMCVFADEGDGFLVEPTEQPYTFGHPFVMLRNYNIPERFYPMGDLEAIECLQHELNATRTALFNDRKQKKRAWLYNEGAFDARGKKQLASNQDNRMIPVTGNVELSAAIIPMPSQQMDPQLYTNSDIIEQDIYGITAQNEYARGAESEIRRTATEASIIQDTANARAADKLAKVENVISQVARRLVQLAQQYMTEEDVVRIVGANGKPVWVAFEPDFIQGEFDFDVEGGSTQPLNEQGRRMQATQMLQTLAPFMVPGGPVNTQEVLGYALKCFGIKDPQRYLAVEAGPPGVGAPPPMEGEPDPNEMPPEGGAPPDQMMPPPEMGGGMGPMEGIPPELAAQMGAPIGLKL